MSLNSFAERYYVGKPMNVTLCMFLSQIPGPLWTAHDMDVALHIGTAYE